MKPGSHNQSKSNETSAGRGEVLGNKTKGEIKWNLDHKGRLDKRWLIG